MWGSFERNADSIVNFAKTLVTSLQAVAVTFVFFFRDGKFYLVPTSTARPSNTTDDSSNPSEPIVPFIYFSAHMSSYFGYNGQLSAFMPGNTFLRRLQTAQQDALRTWQAFSVPSLLIARFLLFRKWNSFRADSFHETSHTNFSMTLFALELQPS